MMQPALMTPDDVREWLASHVPVGDFAGQRVLLIVPDSTRTAPLPLLFHTLASRLLPVTDRLDVLVALGTHPPMSQEATRRLLGIESPEQREAFSEVGLFNHEWHNPERLMSLGTLTEDDTDELSGGLLRRNVPVEINSRIRDYDVLLVLGPVFPHEVVGFSGGNKYFFPGISGPELLNFFHWLGALLTNREIIGVKETPVRKVVDRAATMIPAFRRCVAFVVSPEAELYGLSYGTPEEAWSAAADLSARVHITRVSQPYRQVLSCAPPMYDELWVAGKCMYKLEPVVADGGELIIYAPHLTEISETHGELIRQVGYHVRDYFTKQWDRFQHLPWGVLAHSTHVRGAGTFDNGEERPRIQVTLATGIPQEVCEDIHLGYRDPAGIDPETFADREDEGILLIRKAGEQLYRLSTEE